MHKCNAQITRACFRFLRIGVFFLLLSGGRVSLKAQELVVKTNFLYDATTSVNVGVEWALGKRTSLDLSGNVNLWAFKGESRFKHWLLQPEWRWWTCEAFNGHFLGVHLHGAQFNVGGFQLPLLGWESLKQHRYEGWLVGAGVSYGYQWVLSRNWNLEASVGVGYAYVDYRKYLCVQCGPKEGEGVKHYWGPTKAALSLVYMFH